MDEDHILYEVTDKVAVITLNRPQRANAQTMGMLDDLDAAWTRAASDDEVKVIVLRANGKHFSSGHDLNSGTAPPEKITLTGASISRTAPACARCARRRQVSGGRLLVMVGGDEETVEFCRPVLTCN